MPLRSSLPFRLHDKTKKTWWHRWTPSVLFYYHVMQNKPACKPDELSIVLTLKQNLPVLQQNSCTDEQLKGEVSVDGLQLWLWTVLCKYNLVIHLLWVAVMAFFYIFYYYICHLRWCFGPVFPDTWLVPLAGKWAPGGHNWGSQTDVGHHCVQTLSGNPAVTTCRWVSEYEWKQMCKCEYF